MTVESKTASLDTLSVTIRVLHVNEKQMTLAVFRQLPQETIINHDGEINTDVVLWGWVNYAIKDNDKWFVVEKNSELFRCVIPDKQPINFLIQRIQKWQQWIDGGHTSLSHVRRKPYDLDNYIPRAKEQIKGEEEFLPKARKINQSIAKLYSYPQLFIAV